MPASIPAAELTAGWEIEWVSSLDLDLSPDILEALWRPIRNRLLLNNV
jgi:hypothetical protein